MTRQVITMTTDLILQKMTATNLFEPNDILNLSRPEGLTDCISAVSFVVSRASINISWEVTISKAIAAAMSFISNSLLRKKKWLFFGATDMWRTPNAVIRHKKFWRTNSLLYKPSGASPEVEFFYGAKIRYAVVTEVNPEHIPNFGEWIRATQSGLMFLMTSIDKQTDTDVRNYFASVFTNDLNNVDWNHVVRKFCRFDFVLVRFSGSFDDPDAAVDLIYNPRLIKFA